MCTGQNTQVQLELVLWTTFYMFRVEAKQGSQHLDHLSDRCRNALMLWLRDYPYLSYTIDIDCCMFIHTLWWNSSGVIADVALTNKVTALCVPLLKKNWLCWGRQRSLGGHWCVCRSLVVASSSLVLLFAKCQWVTWEVPGQLWNPPPPLDVCCQGQFSPRASDPLADTRDVSKQH